jgi:phage terminase large subunit
MIELNNKYKPLIGSNSRYFIVTGGRMSGKSFAISSVLLMLTFEVGHIILFTRYTMASTHISIIPEFISKIESLNLTEQFEITKTEIINKTTGSKILFKGIKTSSGLQTANLKSISGVTTWVIDEAEELVDENVFDKIDLSIRTTTNQNRVIVVMNPSTKEHFIYKRFFEDNGVNECSNLTKNNVTYIHSTYNDNLDNVSSSVLQQINQIKLNNPSKFNHIIEGRWLDRAEGVIYSNWSIGEFRESDKTIFGLDFGFSIDPSALVAVTIEGDTLWVKELIYKNGMVTSDYVSELKSLKPDSLIIADSAEGRLIEELRRHNLNIEPIKKGSGSVVEGITFTQEYKIIVDPSSINMIKELNNYSWSNQKAGLPIDKWNHLCDSMRYCVMWSKTNNLSFDYEFYLA